MTVIIKHIIHLSDIHIRPLERHDEYQEVFNNLYDSIKTRTKGQETAIVICGDILHEKDRLKAETFTFTRKFFKDLLAITPHVIIFSGNHDLIEHNPNRLDSLWAISQDIPIIYIRNTSVHPIGDLTFCLNSLIDKKFHDPESLKSNFPNSTLIGLYHGTLNQVRSFNNFALESKVTKEQFAHYHLTLLGDIHKFQFITPTMAYCGSLIQQNFGESLDAHGYIHWQPKGKSRTVWKGTHIPVKNNYGFLKIPINQQVQLPLPPNVNVTFYIPPGTKKECIDQTIKTVSTKCNILTQNLIYEEGERSKEPINTIAKGPEDDLNVLKALTNNHPKQDEIIAIHKEYQKIIPKPTESSAKYFKINRMEFENIFIYHGSYNIIDFTQMGNIIAIPGPNAIGKSCILKILSFALFNAKPDTNISIIYKNANRCKIVVYLSTGDANYRVTRVVNKTSKNPTCLLEKKTSPTLWTNESASSVDQTIKKISELIGLSYDDFLINYVFTNTSKSFLSLPATQMITILNEHFQLNTYKLIQDKVKENIVKLNEEINKLTYDISTTKEILKEQKKKVPMPTPKTSQELKEELKVIKKAKKNINYAAITFKFKETGKSPIETDQDFQTLYNNYIQITNGAQYDPNEYQHLVNTLAEIQERIENNYSTDIKSCQVNSKTIQDSLNKWSLFKQKLAAERKTLVDFIDHFSVREAEIKEFITSILQGTYEFIPKNIKEITPEIYKQVLAYRQDLEQLTSLTNAKEAMEIQFKNSEKAIELQRKLIYLQNKAIQDQIKLEEEERQLSDLYHKRQDWELHEEYRQSKKINIKAKEIKINELTDQLNLLKTYSDLVAKDKIPFQILKTRIEHLNNHMNDFLKSFANFTIDINSKIAGSTEKLDIIIKKGELNLSAKDLSGYETFILNMAFKYILSKFNLVNKISLLFIDEGLDCIDAENFQKLPILFERLSQFYEKVILISHIPEIKDLAQSSIKIERVNNISSRIVNDISTT